MAKPPSPLLGFNNNVKHQGRIFHVQTEDSGINRPHILTHLFADGGRIIKSTRTDYAEHIGRPDMSTVVRRIMKEQHKGMFIALRDGQLDLTIETVLGPVVSTEQPAADPVPEAAGTPSAEGEDPASSKGVPAKRKSKPAPTLTDAPPPQVSSLPAPPLIVPEVRSPGPVPRVASPTLTDLVLADLEAARARGLPASGPGGAKPPGKGGTPVLGTPAQPAGAPRPPVSGRYAASRPAAIFASNPEQGSIFGGSSISEQSLDEVILSYLAEDLEGSAEE